MSLTQLEIKYAKAGMHSDGNGLYLLARKGGAKSWIFRYTFDGKRREMGLCFYSHCQLGPELRLDLIGMFCFFMACGLCWP